MSAFELEIDLRRVDEKVREFVSSHPKSRIMIKGLNQSVWDD